VRIGFNTWSLAKVPYTTFIPGLADIGYTAIAISVVPGYTIGGQWVPNAGDLEQLSGEDRRRLRTLLEERGLMLASIVGNQSLLHDDADRNSAALARLRASIDLCTEVAPRDGSLPTLNTGLAGKSGDLESKRELVLERLGALVDYARARGVVVCIEPHVGGSVDTLRRAEWVVSAIDSPHCRLDFDVSHFEVQCVPMTESVTRLAPLAGAAEIKDQLTRSAGDDATWQVAGNGGGEATAPDGRPLRFQFLLGGEGDFELPEYLRLMQANGWTGPIAFEASVQCQARPDYDGMREAERTYDWMAAGWHAAGISPD
jgi:sugar phosphate isomerase/epimerase